MRKIIKYCRLIEWESRCHSYSTDTYKSFHGHIEHKMDNKIEFTIFYNGQGLTSLMINKPEIYEDCVFVLSHTYNDEYKKGKYDESYGKKFLKTIIRFMRHIEAIYCKP